MVVMIGRMLCQVSKCAKMNSGGVEQLWPYFRGSFVIGMTAMKIIIASDRALGYPGVRKMLEVTSSCTPLPNMV